MDITTSCMGLDKLVNIFFTVTDKLENTCFIIFGMIELMFSRTRVRNDRDRAIKLRRKSRHKISLLYKVNCLADQLRETIVNLTRIGVESTYTIQGKIFRVTMHERVGRCNRTGERPPSGRFVRLTKRRKKAGFHITNGIHIKLKIVIHRRIPPL
nr:hypothetical protein HSTRRNID_HSTRRNID_CDS_0002 [Microvirus sp.]CAI9750401.1 hypothetical protein JDKBDVFQ_JDKBDVFQ_CDS_0002 [Microvirus sp.]